MAKQASETLVIEPTLGDGNCAFNAFVLGFCEQSVLDGISEYANQEIVKANSTFKAFFEAVKIAMQMPDANWEDVKQVLIRRRASDKIALQKLLAPIMRQVAMDRVESILFTEEEIMNGYIGALQAAFEKYKENNFGGDDIFRRHPFVMEKFREYKRLSLVEAGLELAKWWRDEGALQFTNAMKRSTEWAGDLELAPLAQVLGVNVDVHTPRLVRIQTLGGHPNDAWPTITLTNPSAVHWSNMRQASAMPLEAPSSREAKKEELIWNDFKQKLESAIFSKIEQRRVSGDFIVSMEPYVKKLGPAITESDDYSDLIEIQEMESDHSQFLSSGQIIQYTLTTPEKEIFVDKVTQEFLDHKYAKYLEQHPEEDLVSGCSPRLGR